MKLHSREWGSGDRVAVLVHGLMSDHRTWRRVAPALADRGYRVVAVDLRGHGASGRGGYSAESWADDLVENLPKAPELAVGHSLGALALATAAQRLAPTRAVYCDPAWELTRSAGAGAARFTDFKNASRDRVAALHPRWEAADVDIEVATLSAWDPGTAHVLADVYAISRSPARPVVPSLVLAADPSSLVPPAVRATLSQRGFEVRTVQGAGHTMHRDDFDTFMTSLHGWI